MKPADDARLGTCPKPSWAETCSCGAASKLAAHRNILLAAATLYAGFWWSAGGGRDGGMAVLAARDNARTLQQRAGMSAEWERRWGASAALHRAAGAQDRRDLCFLRLCHDQAVVSSSRGGVWAVSHSNRKAGCLMPTGSTDVMPRPVPCGNGYKRFACVGIQECAGMQGSAG